MSEDIIRPTLTRIERSRVAEMRKMWASGGRDQKSESETMKDESAAIHHE